MSVTIENLAPCRKLLRFEIDAQTVDAAFEEMTTEVAKQASMQGFRPGKAPRAMVARQHAKSIADEVRRKLFNDSYKKAVNEHKLHVVAGPDTEEIQFGRGKSMQYAATIETAPEFELPEYKGLKVRKEVGSVTDADIDKAIESLRQQRAEFRDVGTPVKTGDIVIVNYTATTDGKPLTDIAPTARGLTEKKDFWMEIKEGAFIPGFTEQLVGASKGDKRTVNVDFPADFVSAPLQNLKGVYEVEITSVKERDLPEVNDAFAVTWGAENLAKLREGVAADLQNEMNSRRQQDVRGQLLKQLQDAVTSELPESMVNIETRNVVYEVIRENQQRGLSKEIIDQQKNEIFAFANNSARDRVKISFALGKIAEKENITTTREELGQRVLAMAAQNQVEPGKFVKDLQKRNGLDQIHEQILFEKVIAFIEANAQIEEVPAGTSVVPAAS